MAQAGRFLRGWSHAGRGGFTFYCPGCRCGHTISTEGAGAWGFNGDLERPTIKPSVKVSSNVGKDGERLPAGQLRTLCHLFVTDGQIQFLPDCDHELAGKTVQLPELPQHLRDDNEQMEEA
jgi:hypothetical protein